MLYLHGAVHLVALSDGRNCKRTSSMWPLLEKFDRRHAGDEQARPLIVTEGASHQKVKEIDASCYLSFALRTLSERPEPLVIFGHSLGDQDEHLIATINDVPDRPIAVGLLDKGESGNRARKAEIHSRMPDLEIHFFDSTAHPLGGEAVRVGLPRDVAADARDPKADCGVRGVVAHAAGPAPGAVAAELGPEQSKSERNEAQLKCTSRAQRNRGPAASPSS